MYLFALRDRFWITEVNNVYRISTVSVQYIRSKLTVADGEANELSNKVSAFFCGLTELKTLQSQ